MKKILLSSFTLIISVTAFASYSTDWIRPADNYLKTGAMIARDKSDNVIVTGYIQTENIYTRKYDKFGNFMWEQVSSSQIDNNYEKPSWVNCDKNKNIYVVGYRYTWSSSWEYPNAVVVLKYNSGGTLLWKQNIDLSYVVGSSTGLRFNLRSELDSKGNLYIGTAGTTPAGLVFIKLNSSGTVLVNTSVNLGIVHGFGSMRVVGNKVVVAGTSTYNQNVALAAWDTSGTFLWSKILNGFSGKDAELDSSGNVYVLTTYPDQVNSNSGNDIVIYKLNSNGGKIWKKGYDFGGEDLAIRFTFVSGKISVIGNSSASGLYLDWITFQINTNGTKLWDARYDEMPANDERPYFLVAKNNGEVFVTGNGGPPFDQNGTSYLRMVTVKYSNTGELQWADTLNVYSGWGIACTLASDSSLFVVSNTKMTAFHFLDHTGTGSCGIPTNLHVTAVNDTSAKFVWSTVTGAYLYHLRYKTTSAVEWTTVSTDMTSIKIKTLSAGTTYNYAVEAVCNSGPSGYTPSLNFTTTGVGYCTTGGVSTAQEYLTFVWIKSIQNSTGNNNGYADFTNLSTDLMQGSDVIGYLSGNLPFGDIENYVVWIDYNRDNDFNDAGEQAVEISSQYFGWITINFTVPDDATPGTTRMRVTQQFIEPAVACGSFPRGETEDYTVNIVTQKLSDAGNQVSELSPEISVFPNPATDYLNAKFSGYEGNVRVRVTDLSGKIIYAGAANTEDQFGMNVNKLPGGIYFLKVTDDSGHAKSLKWVKE